MDELDKRLTALLESNARESTSHLARQLNLSRSTVQARIKKLERQGVIAGYTIRFNPDYTQKLITAHVMISVNPKSSDQIVRKLKKLSALKSLHTVSGQYDLIAILAASTTQEIDSLLDDIGRIEGIEKTTSSIVLSTKFER